MCMPACMVACIREPERERQREYCQGQSHRQDMCFVCVCEKERERERERERDLRKKRARLTTGDIRHYCVHTPRQEPDPLARPRRGEGALTTRQAALQTHQRQRARHSREEQ